jgi:hypothetical protein
VGAANKHGALWLHLQEPAAQRRHGTAWERGTQRRTREGGRHAREGG